MTPHPYLPATYTESEATARLSWVQAFLTEKEVWRGFEHSTSAHLSNLFRPSARIRGATSLIVELEAAGMDKKDLVAMACCLPTHECTILAAGWLRTNKLDLVDDLISLLDVSQQSGLLRSSIRWENHEFFDKHAPHLAHHENQGHLTAAMEAGNEHAGIWLLAHTPHKNPLDFARHLKTSEQRETLDRWWAQGLSDGRIATPSPSRPLKHWRKRLPHVNAFFKRMELEQMAGVVSQETGRHKARAL